MCQQTLRSCNSWYSIQFLLSPCQTYITMPESHLQRTALYHINRQTLQSLTLFSRIIRIDLHTSNQLILRSCNKQARLHLRPAAQLAGLEGGSCQIGVTDEFLIVVKQRSDGIHLCCVFFSISKERHILFYRSFHFSSIVSVFSSHLRLSGLMGNILT